MDGAIPGRIGDAGHSHMFLGAASAANESKTWIVVGLTAVMTLLEIVGGSMFHSIALVADGLHMSTHAGVMLLAALAYRYARRHAADERFALGTGKLGDLAAFTSAIVLALFAALIAYEAISRFLAPERIDYAAAIPIAVLGLVVNAVSAFVLAGEHDHSHGHSHGAGHGDGHGHDEVQRFSTGFGVASLSVFEDNVPPRFRLEGIGDRSARVETVRADGVRQMFVMASAGGLLESVETIPEPHEFTAIVTIDDERHEVRFAEHGHDNSLHNDNNMRAAYVHVLADSAVSALVIVGLLMAKFLGWVWMDPIMGIVGALVIANWSYGLIRAAGAILLDMAPPGGIGRSIRTCLERDDTTITDLHVWRLGPGHLGAIVALQARNPMPPSHYRARLAHLDGLSHVTIEVDGA